MRATGTAVIAAMLMVTGSGTLPAQTTEAERLAQGWRLGTLMADTIAALPAGLEIPASRAFNHHYRFRRPSQSSDLTTIWAQVTAPWNPNNFSGFPLLSSSALGRPPFSLMAGFAFKGSEPRSLPRYVILIFGNGELQSYWRFQDDQSVRIVVDDTLALVPGEKFYDRSMDTTSAGGQHFNEMISGLLTLEQFIRIVDGQRVTALLGSGRAIWTFKEEELEVMRDLASRMQPKGKKP